MLSLYNSLSQKKEIFEPLRKTEVSIYVCGITPYDTTHLGHAFVYISFDVLMRFLKHKGYKVNYVQNVTDIDDDILKKAKEEKRDWKELGNYWTEIFLNDLKALNVLLPTHYTKATDSIDEMINIIEDLLSKKFAYKSNGNIYFDISKDKDYGHLSKYTDEQMRLLLRERGGDPDDPNKKNALDFVLWQKSNNEEPSWPFDSAQGMIDGRPGWHIECSAMIHKYLGKQIDIHGGGKDLIYPHHESEIAQSENYTGKKPFVKYWMHIAMVMSCGEKMSKSLGNLVMVRDLLKMYSANEIRWYLLSHHYRNPWEYMESDLEESAGIVRKILIEEKNASKQLTSDDMKKITELVEDDLNTPRALEFIKVLSSRGIKVRGILRILGFHVPEN
ncbi:MAG: cysteine--tRNA ligase [Patescibacteria group bacterium]